MNINVVNYQHILNKRIMFNVLRSVKRWAQFPFHGPGHLLGFCCEDFGFGPAQSGAERLATELWRLQPDHRSKFDSSWASWLHWIASVKLPHFNSSAIWRQGFATLLHICILSCAFGASRGHTFARGCASCTWTSLAGWNSQTPAYQPLQQVCLRAWRIWSCTLLGAPELLPPGLEYFETGCRKVCRHSVELLRAQA